MATEIKCEKKVIREIFNMWYCIPDYQRAYVWDTDQVRDLLDDTISAYRENKEAQYFLGSMVLKINEKSENNVSYTEYELLDGQQRITTVFLILACMRDMPLLDTRRGKDLMGTFLSDIVLQVLSFVAENERSNIRQRQAEGIAAAKARGVKFGRPPKPLPENFHAVYQRWKNGKITGTRAAEECNMPITTFRYKADIYEKTNFL